MLLILNSCNKESTTQPEYKIEEYIAPTNLNVKNEIIDFLKVAGRIQGVAKSEGELFLEDKDPNEGVWLMKAALNFERYNDFSKEINYKKEYTLNISNKLLPGNIIKMDADDIILKYNELLSQIIQEEIGERKAKLIDFKVENVTQAYTSVSILALFGGGDDDVLGPDDPGSSSYSCQYQYLGLSNEEFSVDWSSDYSNISTNYNNGIFSSFAFNYNIGGFGYFFNMIAREQNIYWNPPVPDGSLPNFLGDFGDQSFTPYTNVILVTNGQITSNYGLCNYVINDNPFLNDFSGIFLNSGLKNYHELLLQIESNLDNSEFIEYRPVYGAVWGGETAHAQSIRVDLCGFVKVNNN